jgi:hypothetical protein
MTLAPRRLALGRGLDTCLGRAYLGRMSAPPEIDLACPHCSYKLRGLPGEVLRCPECGFIYARQYLLRELGSADRRLTELRAAVKGQSWALVAVTMMMMVVGALALGTSQFRVVVAWQVVPLVVFFVVIDVISFRRVRRLTGQPGWWRPLLQYHAAFWGRGAVWVLAVALTAGVAGCLVWLVPVRPGFIFGGMCAALLLVLFLLVYYRPTRWLRARQERFFDELARLARANAAPEGIERAPSAQGRG